MTQLLVSVLSVGEAQAALEGGADIIDLKDARHGALGALPHAVIRAAVETVGGRRPVSAPAGDLEMQPEPVRAAAAGIAALGVDFVKVGLFPGGDLPACLDALGGLSMQGVRLVAVLFADRRPDFDLADQVAARGFAGIMLDTASKDGRRLSDHLDSSALQAFLARARLAGLFTGLAGSLRLADVPPLLELAPDYLGFRGALTSGRRGDALDPAALDTLRRAIPLLEEAHDQSASSAKIAKAVAGAQQAVHSASPASALINSEKST